jgi:hypothetical protein
MDVVKIIIRSVALYLHMDDEIQTLDILKDALG